MAYKVPTLDELQSFLVALFKALLPNRNIGSRFSFYWKLIKVIAGAVTDVHAHVVAAGKDIMPDTTSKAAMDRWLKIVGTFRKGATPSRKTNAGRITGTAGTVIPIDTQCFHRPTGLLFKINEAAVIPAAGFIDVDIVAISTGSLTRLQAKEVLELSAGIAGASSQIKLQLNLDEDGYDNELDGAAQVRLLSALGDPAAGGNQADFVKWMLQQIGINAAYCYPNRAGIGSVDVAALHTGTGVSRLLSAGERNVLLGALQLLAPTQLGAPGGALRVLITTQETLNPEDRIEVTVTPDGQPAYAMDWEDSVAPIVLLWTALTRTLQFTLARPATMKAGDRICIKGIASDQDCAPVVIESLSGLDSVVLSTVPKKKDGTDGAPGATDIVYAGGPLTAPIRDAIIAHMNSDVLYAGSNGPLPGSVAARESVSVITLNRLLDGIGTANPAGKYGAWSGAFRRSAIATICQYTRGVRNHVVVSPATDVEATDPPFPKDDTIGVLSAGAVLVRKG